MITFFPFFLSSQMYTPGRRRVCNLTCGMRGTFGSRAIDFGLHAFCNFEVSILRIQVSTKLQLLCWPSFTCTAVPTRYAVNFCFFFFLLLSLMTLLLLLLFFRSPGSRTPWAVFPTLRKRRSGAEHRRQAAGHCARDRRAACQDRKGTYSCVFHVLHALTDEVSNPSAIRTTVRTLNHPG